MFCLREISEAYQDPKSGTSQSVTKEPDKVFEETVSFATSSVKLYYN